jgi:predicted nucleotidyltransferase
MIDQRDLEIAIKFRERLSNFIDIIDIRVYGSRARGNADKFSDLDVFLEVNSLQKVIKDKILDVAWEVGFENFIVISPLIFTKEEIENSPLRISPIVKKIMEEGIKI